MHFAIQHYNVCHPACQDDSGVTELRVPGRTEKVYILISGGCLIIILDNKMENGYCVFQKFRMFL